MDTDIKLEPTIIDKRIVSTREFEWNVKSLKSSSYHLSEYFDIILEEDRTKWQLILFSNSHTLYAMLKNVESSSSNFIVDLAIKTNSPVEMDKVIRKQFAGGHLDSWFYVLSLDYMYSRGLCSLVLEIEMSLTRNDTKLSDSATSEPIKLLSNYGKLFNTETLSDFKFICSDKVKIPVHKFVLIAHSPVMFKMVMSPMKEAKTQSAKLEDIDSETMMEVLRFLYTGTIENIESFAPDLLFCADKYELNELKTYAARAMANSLTVDNVLEYYTLADRYNEQYLLGKCVGFIKNNYQDLKTQEQWTDFDSKLKALLQYFVIDEYENAVYVLKTSSTYSAALLPEEYIKFK